MSRSVLVVHGDLTDDVMRQLQDQFPGIDFVVGEVDNKTPVVRRKSTTHAERFVHFKPSYFEEYNEGGVGDNDDQWYTPRAVTAFCREEKGEQPGWYVSFALTHPNDQFSRTLGRKVARRHYFAGERVFLGLTISYDQIETTLWDKLANG